MDRVIRMRFGKGPLLVLALLIGFSFPVLAAEADTKLPNTMGVGSGLFEYFKHPGYLEDADIRFEYRWGLSLLSQASESLALLDPYFQLHPFMGVETTPRGNVYGFGGLIFDFLVGRYFVISPNFAVGLYSQGGGKRLGSPIEFRSTAEGGLRFENNMRLTVYVSHISNAELTKHNPGAEMAGLYLHLPF